MLRSAIVGVVVVPGATGAPGATDVVLVRLRPPNPPHEDQKNIDNAVPRAPTMSRMMPIVFRLTPLLVVSTVTANARIAPTAINRIPTPIPMAMRLHNAG